MTILERFVCFARSLDTLLLQRVICLARRMETCTGHLHLQLDAAIRLYILHYGNFGRATLHLHQVESFDALHLET